VTVEGIVLEVPDLATETIRLRPWRGDDAATLSLAWHDPDIIAGSRPPVDRSVPAASHWIEGCEVRRQAGVAFDLVIAACDDDRVLGEVGFSRFDVGRRAALMGWWVHPEERGRGVAGEAVGSLTEWALNDGGLVAILAEIDPTNVASERVAQRAGFRVMNDTRNPQETARGRGARVWYVANSTVK